MNIKERVYVIEVNGEPQDTVGERELYDILASFKRSDVEIIPIGDGYLLNNINDGTGMITVLTESVVMV